MENQKQWDFLKNKYEAGQLSHAYLFSGSQETQKELFTVEFIKFINCTGKDKNCGECQSCRFIRQESFPDLLVIKSINSDSSRKNEKDMMEIDVDQIRAANNFLSYKSYYGNYKAVVIENADRMNTEAQNSFLKTLEEPKGKTLIFLISSNPDYLLPTIFSRCQAITFFPDGKYQESKEDQKTLQSLLQILPAELAVKFQFAKKVNLEGDHFSTMLSVLQRYLRNMLLMKIGVKQGVVPAQFANYPIGKLKKIIELTETLHEQVSRTNASPKLALEILLIEIAPQSI